MWLIGTVLLVISTRLIPVCSVNFRWYNTVELELFLACLISPQCEPGEIYYVQIMEPKLSNCDCKSQLDNGAGAVLSLPDQSAV